MHRQRVAAVLELVLDLDRFAGQLSELAHGDESGPELMGERTGEDESARFDPHDDFDPLLLIPLGQQIHYVTEGRPVLEERRDVLEQDAFGREILDVADLRPETGQLHRGGILRAPAAPHKDPVKRMLTRPGCPHVSTPTLAGR